MTCEKIRWPIRADVRALGCGFLRTAPRKTDHAQQWAAANKPSDFVNFLVCVGVRLMPVFAYEKASGERTADDVRRRLPCLGDELDAKWMRTVEVYISDSIDVF